ncbi:MAG: sugar ABC transporter ATP-binding protein [Desulfosarcinaceae bacterium]|nr:sugar ABC transporter ATP-binding protein [Desulfosarcinaceae bacterium]
MAIGPCILRMEGITKRFPGVKALDEVRFDLCAGEIHALAGENGAGKSTLMKILSGEYQADGGTIHLKDNPVEIANPQTAQTLGIAIINQELALIPYLSVAENIFLGREPVKQVPRFVDWQKLNQDAAEYLQRLKLDFGPQTLVEDLSIAQQQMVEVAKALSLDAQILIMDEPTSALTEKESEILFDLMAELKARGIAVVYISHRMEEIQRLADRVTVFRDGRYVATSEIADITIEGIIQQMVGRKLQAHTPVTAIQATETALKLVDLTVHRHGIEALNLSLGKGEVLGIAGLVGAGRSELARSIFGVDPIDSGDIFVDGRKVRIQSPKDAIAAGIGLVPENRKEQGLLLKMAVGENITINILKRISRFLFLNKRKAMDIAQTYIEKLKVKTPGAMEKTINLSGGNQQKIVIAKWLTMHPQVMILDEPTRGIDIGAKNEIYALIRELAGSGMGILIISSELPEILRLCNRIAVMSQRKITAILSREDATQERIMTYATGG